MLGVCFSSAQVPRADAGGYFTYLRMILEYRLLTDQEIESEMIMNFLAKEEGANSSYQPGLLL